MPNFNIIRVSEIEKTYRVARIMSDFDVKEAHTIEKFVGGVEFPEKWNIGVICGASGTGKSTIAKELFKDSLYTTGNYTAKSVIDDMPKSASVDEIEKMFYTVGFGSVPSWLKPFSALSNGEKMRVELANALLKNDFVVFDEFTSVVDRNVAQVASYAISKAIKKTDKKFIAVTCHKDVIPWLQPDWVFDTNIMQMVFHDAHGRAESLCVGNVGANNGKNLGVITI